MGSHWRMTDTCVQYRMFHIIPKITRSICIMIYNTYSIKSPELIMHVCIILYLYDNSLNFHTGTFGNSLDDFYEYQVSPGCRRCYYLIICYTSLMQHDTQARCLKTN
jgi:hypothetical protein